MCPLSIQGHRHGKKGAIHKPIVPIMIFPEFPKRDALLPSLRKPKARPGSVILLAIKQPEVCNFGTAPCREERKTLKAALERARKKRAQSESRDGSGMIDELTAEEFPARYFARKVALCVPVARRKPRNPKAIQGTSLHVLAAERVDKRASPPKGRTGHSPHHQSQLVPCRSGTLMR